MLHCLSVISVHITCMTRILGHTDVSATPAAMPDQPHCTPLYAIIGTHTKAALRTPTRPYHHKWHPHSRQPTGPPNVKAMFHSPTGLCQWPGHTPHALSLSSNSDTPQVDIQWGGPANPTVSGTALALVYDANVSVSAEVDAIARSDDPTRLDLKILDTMQVGSSQTGATPQQNLGPRQGHGQSH